MSTDEALQVYGQVAGTIFSSENRKRKSQDGSFKASTLEKEVKKIVSTKLKNEPCAGGQGGSTGGDGNNLMQTASSDHGKGKSFVCAVPANSVGAPIHFRSYGVPKYSSINCTIWEAARATTAAPTFFKRIAIAAPGHAKEEFVDAGLGCNNPVMEVLEEARIVFGDYTKIGCIVSIGTGHPGPIGFEKPRGFQKFLPTQLITVLKEIATDCESTARTVERRFQNHPDVYFRLNVAHGAGSIALDEWKKMGHVVSHTRAYMQETSVSRSLDSIVEHLKNNSRTDGVALAQVMC